MSKEYQYIIDDMHAELEQILNYWTKFGIDNKDGGFVGQRDFYNTVVPNADKGIILNTRLLWSFSAASNYLKLFQRQSL